MRIPVTRDPYVRLFAFALLLISLPYVLPGLHQWAPYSHYYGEPVLYLLCFLALVRGRKSRGNTSEARFWLFVGTPFLFWAATASLRYYEWPDNQSSWMELTQDIAYLPFYLFFFLATELRPDISQDSSQELSRRIRTAGFVVLLISAFGYFVLIPSYINPSAFQRLVPSYFLYVSMDALIAIRFTQLYRVCTTQRWRVIYGCFTFAAWFLLFLDLFEWLDYVELIKAPWGSVSDFLYDIPLALVVVLGALKNKEYEERQNVDDASHPVYKSPMVLLAFTLPLAHFTLSRFNLLDSESIPGQEVIALTSMILLGGLAVLEDHLLRRRHALLLKMNSEAKITIEKGRTELLASEDRFRSAAVAMPVGLLIATQDSKVLDCNQAICALLGYSKNEILERSFEGIFNSEADETLQIETIVREASPVYSVSRKLTGKAGGVVLVNLTFTLLKRGAEVPYILALIEDVTEKKRLEAQLARSQRLEAVGQLAGGIAHDFNNLLTVILGNAEFISVSLDPDDPCSSRIEEIESAAERAASLTQQLLAFSSRQMLSPKVINLNEIIKNLQPVLRRLTGENIQMIFELDAELGTAECDPSQMEQVLLNLVLNSRDAIDKQGTIRICTSNVFLNQTFTGFEKPVVPRTYIKLQVSDNGRGMDEKTLERVFDPFFTTKSVGKSSGLGLAIVYGIVKQSGGTATAESKVGEGTKLNVFLPQSKKRVNEETGAAQEFSERAGSETILLVEDEFAVRSLARLLLAENGYNVIEAADSDEALRILSEKQGRIDLLLTDIVMPGMNGSDLAKRAVSSSPNLPVVFMSGYAGDAISSLEGLKNAGEILQKPFTRKALLTKVQQALTPAAALDQQIAVLLVDDSDAVRNALAALLELHRYVVEKASNADEALAILEKGRTLIRLLITDITLPKMSGFELARIVQKSHPDVRMLFMSGRTAEQLELEAFPGSAFLQKPFQAKSLIEVIQDLIQTSKHEST